MPARLPRIHEISDQIFLIARKRKDAELALAARDLRDYVRSFEHGITVLRRGMGSELAEQQRQKEGAGQSWTASQPAPPDL